MIVCVNRRLGSDAVSCAGRGSQAVAAALEDGIKSREIGSGVVRFKCLGSCQHGPNVRFAPGGAWFSGVALKDVPEILDNWNGCWLANDTESELIIWISYEPGFGLRT